MIVTDDTVMPEARLERRDRRVELGLRGVRVRANQVTSSGRRLAEPAARQ